MPGEVVAYDFVDTMLTRDGILFIGGKYLLVMGYYLLAATYVDREFDVSGIGKHDLCGCGQKTCAWAKHLRLPVNEQYLLG